MTTTTGPDLDLAPATRNPRVTFVSLGCAKNLVDSEVMIGKLGAAGWDLVPDASDADAIVVNTCAFIDPAKAESTDVILEHAQRKRDVAAQLMAKSRTNMAEARAGAGQPGGEHKWRCLW